MASPGELVQTVAAAFGIPAATVVQYDRNLLAAGLRSKGGRGLSAARISSRDAANLLIAIAGGPISGATVKETKATYDKFARLHAFKGGKPGNFPRKLKSNFPTIGRLSRGHTFVEAITAVIDSAVAGEFRDWTTIHIGLSIPNPRASVHVGGNMLLYWPDDTGELDEEGPDLSQDRRFTEPTIRAVARLLRS